MRSPKHEIISKRVRALRPSPIRRFFDLVEALPEAISLSVGEPDFVTPWHIREAAIYSLERGQTHYTPNRGTFELRQEIARYLERRFGLTYDPETEILVTLGVS
jgi:aminotransferase